MDSTTSILADCLFEAVYEGDYDRVFKICIDEKFLKN